MPVIGTHVNGQSSDGSQEGSERPHPGVLREALRFSLCGLAVGASDYTTFFILRAGFDWSVLAAQSVCRPVGGLVSFVLNRAWTFRHRRGVSLHVQFGRFWVVWASAYVMALAFVWVYARLMPGHPTLAKVCADGTVAAVTFLLQRQWTFAKGRPES